jgi:hypothetical protein
VTIGEITIMRETAPDGADLARITRADETTLISFELLDLARAGDVKFMVVEGDTITLTDDFGHRSRYKLGTVDEAKRAQWMTRE